MYQIKCIPLTYTMLYVNYVSIKFYELFNLKKWRYELINQFENVKKINYTFIL